jgi:transmembrane sensor
MWRGLQQRPTQPARHWLVVGAALAVLALFLLRSSDAGPLAARGATTLAFDRPSTVLSDGSRIELAANSQLQLLENNGQSFALQLQRGRARFAVTPGGPRRWRMECGLASVSVVGTELTIERSPSTLRVEVAHGIVEVRGQRVPGGVQRLSAGQALQIDGRSSSELNAAISVSDPLPSSTPDLPPTASAQASDAKDASPEAPPAELSEPSPTAQPPRARTHETRPQAAVLSHDSARSQDDAPRASSESAKTAAPSAQRAATQLLAAADRARQSGEQDRALTILRELLHEQPGTPEAGIAGFTLARMQMERDPRAAAEALRASLVAAAPASLREDALARLVEAYARSGDLELASSTAAEYRQKYPGGRRLAEVEHWAAQP